MNGWRRLGGPGSSSTGKQRQQQHGQAAAAARTSSSNIPAAGSSSLIRQLSPTSPHKPPPHPTPRRPRARRAHQPPHQRLLRHQPLHRHQRQRRAAQPATGDRRRRHPGGALPAAGGDVRGRVLRAVGRDGGLRGVLAAQPARDTGGGRGSRGRFPGWGWGGGGRLTAWSEAVGCRWRRSLDQAAGAQQPGVK